MHWQYGKRLNSDKADVPEKLFAVWWVYITATQMCVCRRKGIVVRKVRGR